MGLITRAKMDITFKIITTIVLKLFETMPYAVMS